MSVGSDWPAPAADVSRAASLLASLPRAARVVLAVDRDVDGLAGGVLLYRVFERVGLCPQLVVARRGEHPHTSAMRTRIVAERPEALVVVDMGSRFGAIVPGVPTIVVDHHVPAGVPDDALLVSAHGREPIASSSWVAWYVARALAGTADELSWLAVLGAYADLGSAAPLPGFAEALAAAGKTHVKEAVALLNAARRAAVPIEEVAARALLAAQNAGDIARARVPGVEELQQARREVADEVARCARIAPRIEGRFAVIELDSGAQVHPLVATRWTRRLHDKIVIAANRGYLPGRVNFVLRAAADIDLLEILRAAAPADAGSEYGHGHARATGGSLTEEAYTELLANLGCSARPRLDDHLTPARRRRARAFTHPRT